MQMFNVPQDTIDGDSRNNNNNNIDAFLKPKELFNSIDNDKEEELKRQLYNDGADFFPPNDDADIVPPVQPDIAPCYSFDRSVTSFDTVHVLSRSSSFSSIGVNHVSSFMKDSPMRVGRTTELSGSSTVKKEDGGRLLSPHAQQSQQLHSKSLPPLPPKKTSAATTPSENLPTSASDDLLTSSQMSNILSETEPTNKGLRLFLKLTHKLSSANVEDDSNDGGGCGGDDDNGNCDDSPVTSFPSSKASQRRGASTDEVITSLALEELDRPSVNKKANDAFLPMEQEEVTVQGKDDSTNTKNNDKSHISKMDCHPDCVATSDGCALKESSIEAAQSAQLGNVDTPSSQENVTVGSDEDTYVPGPKSTLTQSNESDQGSLDIKQKTEKIHEDETVWDDLLSGDDASKAHKPSDGPKMQNSLPLFWPSFPPTDPEQNTQTSTIKFIPQQGDFSPKPTDDLITLESENAVMFCFTPRPFADDICRSKIDPDEASKFNQSTKRSVNPKLSTFENITIPSKTTNEEGDEPIKCDQRPTQLSNNSQRIESSRDGAPNMKHDTCDYVNPPTILSDWCSKLTFPLMDCSNFQPSILVSAGKNPETHNNDAYAAAVKSSETKNTDVIEDPKTMKPYNGFLDGPSSAFSNACRMVDDLLIRNARNFDNSEQEVQKQMDSTPNVLYAAGHKLFQPSSTKSHEGNESRNGSPLSALFPEKVTTNVLPSPHGRTVLQNFRMEMCCAISDCYKRTGRASTADSNIADICVQDEDNVDLSVQNELKWHDNELRDISMISVVSEESIGNPPTGCSFEKIVEQSISSTVSSTNSIDTGATQRSQSSVSRGSATLASF